MRALVGLVVAGSITLWTPLAAGAATVVHPTPEDVAALRGPGALRVSADGRFVVYQLTTNSLDPEAKRADDDTDAGWNRERQIWLLDAAGGTPRQLTQGKERAGSPRWSPDGQSLAFLRESAGQTRIHVLPLQGGEAIAVATGSLEPGDFRWSPDGTSFAFTAPAAETEAEKETKWRTGGVTRWDAEWRSDQLWTVLREGGEPKRVTRGDEHVVDFEWSPDGKEFLLLLARSSDPYEISGDVWPVIVGASDGRELRRLEDEPRSCESPRWSPDGKRVALLTTRESLSMLNVLAVHDAKSGRSWNAAPSLDFTFTSFAWSADGGSLLALVSDRTLHRILRFPAAGGPPEDTGFGGRIVDGGLEAPADGRFLVFLSSNTLEPADPTRFDPYTGAVEVLARLNPEVETWTLGKTEVVRWRSPEGVPIEGLLTVPPRLGRGRRPPLLVYPHGGPDAVTSQGWSATTQYFAARGYAVFRPNYRGSLAYGHDFYAANRGRLGEIEFMDIESGVDSLIATGRVDPDRMCYGSWSWGGYLSLWTVAHTDRYRAAVVGAGVNDVMLSYSLSDINHGTAAQWEFRGDPWRQTENFDRANPIRFVRNVRTPTLILHGEKDDRVPFQQGIVLYRALRDLGVPVRFDAYPREPHGFREPAHVAHRLQVWLEWLDEHSRARRR